MQLMATGYHCCQGCYTAQPVYNITAFVRSGFLGNFSDAIQPDSEVEHDHYHDVGGDSQRWDSFHANISFLSLLHFCPYT